MTRPASELADELERIANEIRSAPYRANLTDIRACDLEAARAGEVFAILRQSAAQLRAMGELTDEAVSYAVKSQFGERSVALDDVALFALIDARTALQSPDRDHGDPRIVKILVAALDHFFRCGNRMLSDFAMRDATARSVPHDSTSLKFDVLPGLRTVIVGSYYSVRSATLRFVPKGVLVRRNDLPMKIGDRVAVGDRLDMDSVVGLENRRVLGPCQAEVRWLYPHGVDALSNQFGITIVNEVVFEIEDAGCPSAARAEYESAERRVRGLVKREGQSIVDPSRPLGGHPRNRR